MFTKKQKLPTIYPPKLQRRGTHYKLSTSSGFTLIELLLAMAIIAILSGAILMNLGSQRKKANQSKLLAEFAGTIQPIMMCRSDGHTINTPHGGTGGSTVNICTGQPNYGRWPDILNTDFAVVGGDYTATFNADGTWFFWARDGAVKICCNSASSKCHTLANGGTCNATTPAL